MGRIPHSSWGNKSGDSPIYFSPINPYTEGDHQWSEWSNPMNEAFAALTLLVLRILLPVTILLSIGEWLDRRKKHSQQNPR